MIAFKCIHDDVLRAFFQLRVVLVAGFLASSLVLHADDKPTAPPGYKMVPVSMGNGHTGYIQVKDASKMYSDGSTPNNSGFNMTSSMANKTFLPDAGSGSGSNYQAKMQSTFATKSYFAKASDATDQSMPGLHDEAPVKADTAFSRRADGFDRSFQTSSADEQTKTSPMGSQKSDDSDRTANMGGHEIKEFAYTDSDKTYTGPEARGVKHDLDRMNQGLESLKDLPDRPLTIDEVRALIDHGVKPDLDEKPAAPSKPLNAPDYQPDAAPAPLREPIQPGHLKDVNDVDTDLSVPGAVAHPDETVPDPAPENSEPLPQ
jgi:hypothetical protein